MFTKRFIWLAVLAMLLPVLAWSQATSGDLVGTVLDKSGAAVPNASISVVNQDTGVKSTAVTTNIGSYRVPNLPVGTYSITASAQGFANKTLKGVVVELNKTSTVNLAIEPGQVATTVEVQAAAAPPIDTTTAQLSTTYDAQEAQLPVASVGAGVLNLSLLQPGVTTSGGLGYGTGPSVSGQRPTNNNFTVEGIDNNDLSVTGPVTTIPNDAVAEMSVLANQFSPEFGHSSGGQFNTVVKSGTNQYHGTVYEYMQNRNLTAVDTYYRIGLDDPSTASNPRYDNNRFGGAVGGPIIKNKLFFFGLLEYNPVGLAGSGGSVCTPSAAGLSALGGITGLNQTNLDIFKKYVPAGTGSACGFASVGGGTNNVELKSLQVNAPSYHNQWNSVGSMDYNISDKDQLRGRWIYNKYDGIDTGASLSTFFSPVTVRSHTVAITEFHTFNPRVTNELRLGFNRLAQDYPIGQFAFPGLQYFPNLTFQDLGNLDVGPNGNFPQNGFQNTYQLTDNVTFTQNAHTWKFGFDGKRYIAPSLFVQRIRGDYEYLSIDTYLKDNSPDLFSERNFANGSPEYYGNKWSYGLFANDSWKINQHLTVNYGIRYEYTTTPIGENKQALNAESSVPGLINFAAPVAPRTNFMPRFGFAYAPGTDGKTSIRGGIGMSYDVFYDNLGVNSMPPQVSYTVDGNPNVPTANFLTNGGLQGAGSSMTAAQARAATSSYIPVNMKDPYTISWNFGVQHVFANVWTADVRYVGTHSLHLPSQDQIDRMATVSATHYLPTFLDGKPAQSVVDALSLTRAPLCANPAACTAAEKANSITGISTLLPVYSAAGFGATITSDQPYGASIYHGLQTSLDRRFTKGLQMLVSYTWSHAQDNDTATLNTTALTPRRPEDFQGWGKEWANSILDRRHRLTISAIYETSFKAHGLLMKNLLDGWNLSPQYTFESPEMATVQSGVDSNNNGDSAGDRAIYNPKGTGNTSSAVTALCLSSMPSTAVCGQPANPATGQTSSYPYVVGYYANDPTAKYIQANVGALTNVGRNTLAMPHTNNWNMSASKKFFLGERMNLEFQAQAFNLFNHPQWIAGSLYDVGVYTSTSVRSVVTTGSSHFNRPQDLFSSNPRTLQLALKFNF